MRPSALRLLFLSLVLLLVAAVTSGCHGLQAGGTEAGNGGGGTLGATVSPVKRVVVVVMQNSSFDHLFGKYAPPAGQTVNGIHPGVNGYSQANGTGTMVTPFEQTNASITDLPHSRNDYLTAWDNGAMDKFASHNGTNAMGYYTSANAGVATLWSLASNYALADDYFSSAMSNAPANPLYMVAASDNDFAFSVQPFYGPCNQPDAASQAYTFPNLGDQMNTANLSWGWFQENLGACGSGYVQVQNPFQYFTSTHAAPQIQDLTAFFSQLNAGTLPAVSFVQPSDAHGGHPGSGSITASLNWLNDLVGQIKATPAWDSIAIVVVWDEGGGFWDHVSPPQLDSQGLGMRVPMLVISPYAKAGYVSHVQMDHVSILKFIDWNWSLPTLNAREDQSADIRDMFQF